MKKVLHAIWSFLCDLGTARYATFLARSGRFNEAKALYK